MNENKESTQAESVSKSSTVKDLALPFKILISPVKAFKQLAINPTAKGLISLAALIIVVGAVALYASATRIVLTIDGQPVDFIATSDFSNWFLGALSTTALSIAIYWLTAAASLALISRFSFKGSKVISLRASLVVFGYLLSVSVVLYAVRAAIYLALPPIPFPSSTWPEIDELRGLVSLYWAPLPAFQLLDYSRYAAFVWLAVLGAIATKVMQEISWFKAGAISATGFILTYILLGPP